MIPKKKRMQDSSPWYTTFRGRDNREVRGEIIVSEPRLLAMQKRLLRATEIAFDTEYTAKHVRAPGKSDLVGISFTIGEHENYYVPVGHWSGEQLPIGTVVKYLKKVTDKPDTVWIAHNSKVDAHMFENYGMSLRSKNWFDTMIATWLINENPFKGLKETTRRVYGIDQVEYKETISTVPNDVKKEAGLKASNNATIDLTTIEACAPYAIADSYWAWRHYVDWEQVWLETEEMDLIFWEMLMPTVHTTYAMERRGHKIDIPKLQLMKVEIQKAYTQVAFEAIELFGVQFDMNSPQQVAEVLFGYKKFNKNKEYVGNRHLVDNSYGFTPVAVSDKTGQPSIGEDNLDVILRMQFPKDKHKQEGQKLIKMIIKYKKLTKLYGTFLCGIEDALYPDGKLHVSFNVAGTDTGRFSCDSINLQQLPRPVEINYPYVGKYLPKDASKEELKAAEKAVDDAVIMDPVWDIPTGIEKKKLAKCGFKFMTQYAKAFMEWLESAQTQDDLLFKQFEIRQLLIASRPDYEIMTWDYENLEMKLLAHFSGDSSLVPAFKARMDVHGDTARRMFNLSCEANEVKKLYKHLRNVAKTINFGIVYGMGPKKLYEKLAGQEARDENGELVTLEKAKEYYSLYFKYYPDVKNHLDNQKNYARLHGFVYTILGRKRRLESINSKDGAVRSYEERVSVNAPIQGSGADMMMMCQPRIEADKRLQELGFYQLAQIHDEIEGEGPKKHREEIGAIVKEYMEKALPRELLVPITTDFGYGRNYSEAK